jgi:tetratricopeptide (TPR) repeat protein
MQRLARVDKPFNPANDPRDVVTEWFLSELTSGRKSNVYWDTKTRDELQAEMRKARRVYERNELMTSALIEDIYRRFATSTVEGAKDLWRVELDQLGRKAPVYLAANRGVVKVIGAPDAPQGAGRHVLRLLAKNDEANASRLLDWLAKDLASGARTNRFAHDLTTLWGDKLPRTRDAMELAAAALTGTSDAARAIPILEKCKPTTTEGQLVCDWALSDLYQTTRRWAELEEHGREWAGRAPKQLGVPVAVQAAALVHVTRFDDADRVLADGLAQFPGHRSFLYSHSEVAIARGNLAEAVKRLQPLAARTPVEPVDVNNLAWLELAEGSDLPGALSRARKAVQLATDSANALNTLAAVLAEIGELGEARQHLIKSMEVKNEERPDDADLYVQGRILEQLGLAQDALALYRLIKAPQSTSFIPQSYDFAKRRLKALGVTK